MNAPVPVPDFEQTEWSDKLEGRRWTATSPLGETVTFRWTERAADPERNIDVENQIHAFFWPVGPTEVEPPNEKLGHRQTMTKWIGADCSDDLLEVGWWYDDDGTVVLAHAMKP